MARCIFLAGAPLCDQLDWSDAGLLGESDLFGQGSPLGEADTSTSSIKLPVWRSLPSSQIRSNPLHSAEKDEPQFLSFQENSEGSEFDQERNEFIDYSIALLEVLEHSPFSTVEPSFNEDTTMDDSTRLTSIDPISIHNDVHATEVVALHRPILSHGTYTSVSDLKSIPSPAYLQQALPHRLTINIIVGVIDIRAARTVRLRSRDAEMDIVEIIVGDETRSGFGISFWLAPVQAKQTSIDDLRSAIASLRTGDVVLLTNIALSTYKGCVYGQSLSKTVSRRSTAISAVDPKQDLPAVMAGKVVRVQEWANHFIGRRRHEDVSHAAKSGDVSRNVEVLPPDTQDLPKV